MEVVRLKNRVSEHDRVLGSPDAPVTLVEYGNFECQDCGRVYPTIKEILKILTGQLLFVFRHFPTVRTHAHALRAAEASEAAGAQGKFWEMHDQLFTHQHALEDKDLFRYAKHIGLDTQRFQLDLAENRFAKQLQADYERSLFDEHVTGTPTFYINEIRYTGPTDVAGLLLAIKESDIDGRIQFPATTGRFRNFFSRLRPVR